MGRRKRRAEAGFLLLAGIFLGSLVVCNLIANKFLTADLGFRVFVLSAGALPYPVTFLVTDLLSEVYGQRRADQVVRTGLVVSLFVLMVLWLGAQFPAIADSPVDDATYDKVFHNAWRVIAASMTAYLVAQFVDIRLFHFWKRLTKGKHLWLRNNASTILSQFLDSTLVVLVLFGGDWPAQQMMSTIFDLWLFKTLVAVADTPFFYLGTALLRRYVGDPQGAGE
ncbi:MAG: queuosine precursor transporter [Planctomycetes bacterium]|nr:queuosine precursor transporter [Planctomycetota bacterium]MBL7008184.1 queuosine precursor transporter [Planctomycetota bacterium]